MPCKAPSVIQHVLLGMRSYLSISIYRPPLKLDLNGRMADLQLLDQSSHMK